MTVASIKSGKFYGWKTLAVVAAMYFAMTGLLLYSFPAILPFLCDFFGWSRASVSWAKSLAMAVTGLVSPLAGMCVMRYGVRKAVVVGGILCILCFVCASFHTRLWELYLAYAVLFGLGGSLCGMLTMTTIVNNWFVKKRSLALSILLAAGGLGGLVMVPFIVSMINRLGWRITYLLITVMIFVLPQTGHGLSGMNYSVDGEGKSIPVAPIPNAFSRFNLLVDWVEKKAAPPMSVTVTAKDRSLPMCSYPMYPRYVSGSVDTATSYACTAP